MKGLTNLQEKLQVAANSDAVVAIVKKAGFGFSTDDLMIDHAEVFDDELEVEVIVGGCSTDRFNN